MILHLVKTRFLFAVLSILIAINVSACKAQQSEVSMPEYLYTGDGSLKILKIFTKDSHSEEVYYDDQNITWNSAPVYIPGNKIMITGNFRNDLPPTIIIDVKTHSCEKRLSIMFPQYFYKHNRYAFLKDGGVYVSKDIFKNDAVKISEDAQAFYPFLLKMSEDEFAFYGYDEKKNKILSVYNFVTNQIRALSGISKNTIVGPYRSKTHEFFAHECKKEKCDFVMTDENGNSKPVPECISKLSFFNTVLQYKEGEDQVYFFSGRPLSNAFTSLDETKDLYLYDYKTDMCSKVLDSLYSTGIVTSTEVDRVNNR